MARGEDGFRMDRAAIFKTEGPALVDLAPALDALGIRLSPQDLEKTAENAALLARHWQALGPALVSSDGAE